MIKFFNMKGVVKDLFAKVALPLYLNHLNIQKESLGRYLLQLF